jgi:glycosyltransferase involved in cell wall biosynthesis
MSKVFQISLGFREGDAISNQILFIKEVFEKEGIKSFVRVLDLDRKRKDINYFDKTEISKNDKLIYHYSMHSILTEFFDEFKGKKIVIYHNQTPAKFFKNYSISIYDSLKKTESELIKLNSADLIYSDSLFNSKELLAQGIKNLEVLPLPYLYPISNQITNKKKQILFVGRISPNKKIEDLLELMFYIHQLDTEIKLVIIGKNDFKKYSEFLSERLQKYKLENVIFLENIKQNELIQKYRESSLFVSMSEHEGFMLPLVEAMWNELPILAYSAGAVPETLGESGILFNKKDFLQLSILSKIMIEDSELRKKVLLSQEKRRIYFDKVNLESKYKEFCQKIVKL